MHCGGWGVRPFLLRTRTVQRKLSAFSLISQFTDQPLGGVTLRPPAAPPTLPVQKGFHDITSNQISSSFSRSHDCSVLSRWSAFSGGYLMLRWGPVGGCKLTAPSAGVGVASGVGSACCVPRAFCCMLNDVLCSPPPLVPAPLVAVF